jgi:hypothetical protein
MQRAEPGPFLFEKIAARIQNENLKQIKTPFIKWAFAIGSATVILVNVLSISLVSGNSSNANEKPVVSELVNEMGYKLNYNY